MILNLKYFLGYLNKLWLNFRLQTKLILASTFFISIGISGLAFWSANLIQQETLFNKIRLANDVTVLLGANLISLTSENDYKGILPLCERFYKNSPNIKYIIFFDSKNKQTYGVPFTYSELTSKFLLQTKGESHYSDPIKVNTSLLLRSKGNEVGTVIVGINSSQNLITNSKLVRTLLVIIVLIFWLTLILGAMINAITITGPLNELRKGIRRVADGNFSHKINLVFNGELGDLILQFNDMGKKLQKYEEKNIDQLLSEKIKLESLVGTITEGALLLDSSLKLVLVNDAAIKIFSWEKKKNLIGSKLWEHLPRPLQKRMFESLEKMIRTSSNQVFYSALQTTPDNNKPKFFRILLKLVYESQELISRPKGIAITIQDCTKELELNQARNRFMSNISHELRTPLFSIRSFIDTTQEYSYTLTTQQKYQFLETVSLESNRLTRLVNNILNLSRLDYIKLNSFEPVDLNDVITKAATNFYLFAGEKKIIFTTNAKPNLALVQGNVDLITQVLVNLIGNSLKFTYPQGEILLRAYPLRKSLGNKIRIEISDTGIGISPIFRKIIFNRFSREENEVHNLTGTGLGLAIVESILKEHNSRIYVLTKQHVGSIFWFDLNV